MALQQIQKLQTYNFGRYVDYKNITKVIKPGRTIYVDDGVLAFDVLQIKDDKNIEARARNNGFISSRKGVNLPNTDIDLPARTFFPSCLCLVFYIPRKNGTCPVADNICQCLKRTRMISSSVSRTGSI